jgi:hypothetical protein
MRRILIKIISSSRFLQIDPYLNQPVKNEAQTALFKDPVRTAL